MTAQPKGSPVNAAWKNLKSIKRNIFPDNKFIISKMLNNKKVKLINSVYDENKKIFKSSQYILTSGFLWLNAFAFL